MTTVFQQVSYGQAIQFLPRRTDYLLDRGDKPLVGIGREALHFRQIYVEGVVERIDNIK